jgi:uncharacterized protein (TIGR03086 family)
MNDVSPRFRNVAEQFTQRARAVTASGWSNPAPCEGWVARDVVRHMVAWMPPFFLGNSGVALAKGPSVDDDPVRAWEFVRDAIQEALDDPEVAAREFASESGSWTLEHAVDTFGIGDVLVHTWDLARATGLDETLDPNEVHRLVSNLDELDALLRPSPHFGPRLDVADDADAQTKLLAFTGRRP